MDKIETNYGSRKLWVTAAAAVFIIAPAAITFGVDPAKAAAFVSMYPTMVGGILTLVGLYSASNVATKWVNGKVEIETDPVEPKPVEPKPENG